MLAYPLCAAPVWHVATRAFRWWPELTDAVDHVVGHPECSADDRAHWAELGAVFAKRNAIATGARPANGPGAGGGTSRRGQP